MTTSQDPKKESDVTLAVIPDDIATKAQLPPNQVTGALWKLAKDGAIRLVTKRQGIDGGSIYRREVST